MLNDLSMYLNMIFHNYKLILSLFEIYVNNAGNDLKYHLLLCKMICI